MLSKIYNWDNYKRIANNKLMENMKEMKMDCVLRLDIIEIVR